MSEAHPDLAVLAKPTSTLAQVMQAIANLERGEHARRISFGISSSVVIDLLGVYLRRHGLLADTRIDVVFGNYDDPIGDVSSFQQAGVEQMLLLPYFDNLLPSFEAQMGNLSPGAVEAKEAEIRARYRIALEKARDMRAVYLCTFHRMGSAAYPGGSDTVSAVISRFNAALREEASAFLNVRIVDSEDIVRAIGRTASLDARFYFRNKAPYTGCYLNELARRVAVGSRGFGAHYFKVLALDCDNTLWGGVVGEDLLGGIKLDPHEYPGNVFWRVQHEFSSLEKNGVLLCLCTKNNPADIEEVLQRHPNMVLQENQFVIKKVNWEDKPSNLLAMAEELNVGLDSVVFLDDSTFECEAVRSQLPMIRTVQVPEALSEYPRVAHEISELFLAEGTVAASSQKTEQYRRRAQAEQMKSLFASNEEYLRSLELTVELTRNARDSTARISELSMKSNQFNLTTRRYSESEIVEIMQSADGAVYSFVVSDKFGCAGLTGAVVVLFRDGVAFVDNFFMSCRVIGRGVETCIWSHIVADAQRLGCAHLRAEFRRTARNAQVAGFYDRLGLPLLAKAGTDARQYGIALADFSAHQPEAIKVSYVG